MLYLIHNRFVFGYADDVISLPGIEVGESYGSDQTFVHKALHCCPSISVVYVRVTNTSIFLSRHQLLPSPKITHRRVYVCLSHVLSPSGNQKIVYSCSLECHRPVHKVQVQIGETKVGQAGSACVVNICWVMFGVPQFGCYKHVLTTQTLEERVCVGNGIPAASNYPDEMPTSMPHQSLTFPGPTIIVRASPTSCSLPYAAAQSMCLYPQSKAASTACFT